MDPEVVSRKCQIFKIDFFHCVIEAQVNKYNTHCFNLYTVVLIELYSENIALLEKKKK